MVLLLVTVSFFQDDQVIALLAFIPAIVYGALNYKVLQEIESIGPSPKELIGQNVYLKALTISLLAIEICWVYYCFLIGIDTEQVIDGVGMLAFAIIGPILPAILVSRIILFRRLRDINP